MNTPPGPEFFNYGASEIFQLLKIGEFNVIANQDQSLTIKPQETVKEVKVKTLKPKFEFKKYFKVVSSKGYLFYPIVFIASFVFFYGALNFQALTAQAQAMFATKSQDQAQLGEDLPAYNAWISGYFYAVSDKSLLGPDNDYDKDGLTNYDEFVMRTNPTVADSDNDGVNDGVEMLDSTNPWGAGAMTPAQLDLRNQIDLTMVSERIGYNTLAASAGKTSDNSASFDLNRNGTLSIPKLNMSVPLIFSKDPSDFDNDLEHGVIHYPGTSLPGQQGMMYVSGHSSDYIWKHDPFATVFTRINHLSPGDDVFITVYGTNGQIYNYRYQVTSQKVYSPDDQTQFIDNSGTFLNLSTCWPIGTSKNRLVVTAKLVNL